MSYYIDAEKVSLDEIQKRIKETDLIPSRSSLLEDIDEKILKLKANGFLTLADLRKGLKNPKNIPALSKKTGIDPAYLRVLRRETESYFPKTCALGAFDWLLKKDLDTLERKGLKNTLLLYESLDTPKKREEMATVFNLDKNFINYLFSLIDLTRIQWTSAIVARMLVAAGYKTVKSDSSANPYELYSDLDRVNKENKYFKGKIGLRDVRRLIKAASYVP